MIKEYKYFIKCHTLYIERNMKSKTSEALDYFVYIFVYLILFENLKNTTDMLKTFIEIHIYFTDNLNNYNHNFLLADF